MQPSPLALSGAQALDFYRRTFPRWATPRGYSSPRDMLAALAFSEYMRHFEEDYVRAGNPPVPGVEYHLWDRMSAALKNTQYRSYFVGHDLAQALELIDPPDLGLVPDIPAGACIIALPQKPVSENAHDLFSVCDLRGLVALRRDGADLHTFVAGADGEIFGRADIPDFFAQDKAVVFASGAAAMCASAHTDVQLAINAIAYMAAKPEYIEPGGVLRMGAGRNGGGAKDIWSPTWVGRRYVLPRAAPSEPTGRTVRLHWRRGHFRRQPYGPAEKRQHKVIVIDPMLIGAQAQS